MSFTASLTLNWVKVSGSTLLLLRRFLVELESWNGSDTVDLGLFVVLLFIFWLVSFAPNLSRFVLGVLGAFLRVLLKAPRIWKFWIEDRKSQCLMQMSYLGFEFSSLKRLMLLQFEDFSFFWTEPEQKSCSTMCYPRRAGEQNSRRNEIPPKSGSQRMYDGFAHFHMQILLPQTNTCI